MYCTNACTRYFYKWYIYTGRDEDEKYLPNTERSYCHLYWDKKEISLDFCERRVGY